MLEGILFDLDDTLLDRRLAIKRLFARFWEEWYRGEIPQDALARLIDWDGNGYNSKAKLFASLFAAYPPERLITLDETMELWYREFPRCFEFPARHRQWLKDIAGRYRTAIVTNGHTKLQWDKIRYAKLDDLVDSVVISEEAGVRKPDAPIFQLALSRIGVAAGRALFLGDHLINDIAGAQAAGMRAVWIRPEGTPREEGFHPDGEIADLTELSRLL